jgi:folate-binding protein YgfZ
MYLIEGLSKFYPLENNLHMLNSVDFKKGCYVGQELTARMKLRNKIPRTIIPFILDLENDKSYIKNEILENDTVVGEIIFQKNEYLFGHITFRKLSKDMSLDMQFSLKDQKLKINQQDWLNF